MTKAIFLDRDGVINYMIENEEHGTLDSPHLASQFRIKEDVKEGITCFKEKGYKVIVVSNQPGVARGYIKKSELEKMDEIMKKVGVDDVFYCIHDKTEKCECRKPESKLLIQGAKKHNVDFEKSIMIGDGWNDIKAGQTVGCKTMLIGRADRTELINLLAEKNVKPDHIVANLKEANAIID